jgi:hypothetical protein
MNMAPVRAKKIAVQKGLAPLRLQSRKATKTTGNPRRAHEFLVNHLCEEDFKPDGLRHYARYRDLGVKDATHGAVVAHVIRFQGPCHPKVVSKLHRHTGEFQLIYVLNASIRSEFEGHGVHTMTAGDAWLQSKNIKHQVLEYSEDCQGNRDAGKLQNCGAGTKTAA